MIDITYTQSELMSSFLFEPRVIQFSNNFLLHSKVSSVGASFARDRSADVASEARSYKKKLLKEVKDYRRIEWLCYSREI